MALSHPIAWMHKAREARCGTARATKDIERDDIARDEGENRRWETTGKERARKVVRGGRCDAAKRERERGHAAERGRERRRQRLAGVGTARSLAVHALGACREAVYEAMWSSAAGSDARAREGRREGAAPARVRKARAARGRRPAAQSAAHTEGEMTRLRHTDRARQRRREGGILLKSEEEVAASQAGGRTARMEW